eukprot:CAMPEP_0180024978 /NCGR_PEP_ID=MMETSP0984-20121128/24382_1 /TAXON_ID=483367 /ORGANISM="non described non described, Strain CCMP 2436" /LENGTH=208 /DNA_ID=CAMNT_0021949523 /DNA_START=320 /DNA_END=944 /DNA_ORIENTATION=-
MRGALSFVGPQPGGADIHRRQTETDSVVGGCQTSRPEGARASSHPLCCDEREDALWSDQDLTQEGAYRKPDDGRDVHAADRLHDGAKEPKEWLGGECERLVWHFLEELRVPAEDDADQEEEREDAQDRIHDGPGERGVGRVGRGAVHHCSRRGERREEHGRRGRERADRLQVDGPRRRRAGGERRQNDLLSACGDHRPHQALREGRQR